MAAAYALYYLVPGFIRGSRVMIGYIGKERASAPLFSWRCYYCLCASESATTVACAAMFYDAGWLGLRGAVLLAVLGNLAGYAKYLVQMWYDHEYVATSIFLQLPAHVPGARYLPARPVVLRSHGLPVHG